jgi:hypothetical protein
MLTSCVDVRRRAENMQPTASDSKKSKISKHSKMRKLNTKLHLTVRRVSDIQKTVFYTLSRYAMYRAEGYPSEIQIQIKPRAKRASKMQD